MGIPVNDPFGVICDPEMPSLALALDPNEAQRQLGTNLPRLAREGGFVHLRSIQVTRYKAGRRCLIEYEVEVERPSSPPETAVLIGKVRAQHRAKSGYLLLDSLWTAGFAADSEDGISVPEPIGVIEDFHMWLQRKVPGEAATHGLTGTDGITLVQRIAEAACKLHKSGVITKRRHEIADELRILHERLPTVANVDSIGTARIERILDAADLLGASLAQPTFCGIHRDFYPDQVILDGTRLHLVDFDLYCEGDPGLDIGNFLGHLTEQSLRTLGDPAGLKDLENAMEQRFVELSGEKTRRAVRVYAILTLVRHIHLSTLKPERRPLTRSLLELCEERLGLNARMRTALSLGVCASSIT